MENNYLVTAVWAFAIAGYPWVFPPAAEALTHGLAAVVKQSFQITHYPEQDPLYVSPGERVNLSCGVESHFDCCTWSHLHKVNSTSSIFSGLLVNLIFVLSLNVLIQWTLSKKMP